MTTPSSFDGPDVSDGCDKDGFPGGCERAGHAPETCPGFQIGDTIKLHSRHIAAGDTGVIVGVECWLNDNEAIPWDRCGDAPVYAGKSGLQLQESNRFLVRLASHNPETEGSTIGGLDGWRERCVQWPHSYPFVTASDMELVSRPEIRVLNDSGCLGSVLGLDRSQRLTCVSDSEAGARKAIADMKVSMCLPLKSPPGSSDKIQFFAREETDTKVTNEISVGFRYWMTTLFGVVEATVTSIDGDSAVVCAGAIQGWLRKKEDGWYDQHVIGNPEAISRVQFVNAREEVSAK